MKTLFKGDAGFIFLITFFFNSFIQSQQLALPIQTAIGTHRVNVNDFVTQSRVYISSTCIKDNSVTHSSILNNMVGNYKSNKKYSVTLRVFSKQTQTNNLEAT